MPNLIFKTLTLENFGSYQEPQTIELDRGPKLVYITGENKVEPTLGSNDVGKSTIINALYWVLTGKTLRSARPGSAIESWTNSNTVDVLLSFNLNNTQHTIRRSRRPNALSLNNEDITQERVTEVLGLSDEAIAHTLIVGQFNKLFLDLDPAVQSRLFTELLDLNIWLKAIDVCSKETARTTKTINETEKSISRAEGSLDEVLSRIGTTKKEARKFDAEKARTLVELRSRLSKEEKIVNLTNNSFQESVRALEQLSDISEQENNIKQLGIKQKELESAISTSQTIIAGNQRELRGIEESLKEYRETDNICPECGQQITSDHIDEKIAGLNARKCRLLDGIESSQQVMARRNRDLEATQEQIAYLDNDVSETRAYMQEVLAQYNKALLIANDAQRTVDETKREIDKAIDNRNPFDAILRDLNSRHNLLGTELDQLNLVLNKENKTLEYFKLWSQGFKEIRLNLIDETLDELEFTVNKHIARLGLIDWEVGFHTERETAKGDLVHKFTVNIFPPGREAPIALESLGGGVSTRLQLGSFFGLSEILLARAGVIPNIEILDEPTRFMSDQGVEDLLESLKERALETGRTIYFVDHSSLDKGLFDATIWIEKSSFGSRVVPT